VHFLLVGRAAGWVEPDPVGRHGPCIFCWWAGRRDGLSQTRSGGTARAFFVGGPGGRGGLSQTRSGGTARAFFVGGRGGSRQHKPKQESKHDTERAAEASWKRTERWRHDQVARGTRVQPPRRPSERGDPRHGSPRGEQRRTQAGKVQVHQVRPGRVGPPGRRLPEAAVWDLQEEGLWNQGERGTDERGESGQEEGKRAGQAHGEAEGGRDENHAHQ
jgi:hypothetical protein